MIGLSTIGGPILENPLEYKLSSFQFSPNMSREDKHLVIQTINSIRSKCPSDGKFTGSFSLKEKVFSGEVKVLFSKGTFAATSTGNSVPELMKSLLAHLEKQIACWQKLRFDHSESFIDYSQTPLPLVKS